MAHAEHRIVVTFDRDFGELVFRRGLRAPAGILCLRFVPEVPSDVTAYVSRLIREGINLRGRFTSADRRRLRQRALVRGR